MHCREYPDHENRSSQVPSHQNDIGDLGSEFPLMRPRSIHSLGHAITFVVLEEYPPVAIPERMEGVGFIVATSSPLKALKSPY